MMHLQLAPEPALVARHTVHDERDVAELLAHHVLETNRIVTKVISRLMHSRLELRHFFGWAVEKL